MSTQFKQSGFLFVFILVYFSVISSPVGYPGTGIDASWAEALAMVIDNDSVFGHDFIFNYGPLGYLNTTILPQTVPVLTLIVFNFITLINYLFIIWFGFQQSGEKWIRVAVASLFIFLPWGFISDISFTYFYFFLFWLLYAHHSQNKIGLFLAALCSILVFYVKVNLSLIVYALFGATLLYFWFCRIFTIKTILTSLGCQLLVTYCLSFLLNVDIVAYLSSSLKIIDAYQDGMAVMIPPVKEILLFLFITGLVLSSVLVVFVQNRLTMFTNTKTILLFVFVASAWFLDFKQAHTAISLPNLFGYYIFMPPLVALIYLFTPKEMSQSVNRLFVVVFCLQLVALQYIRYQFAGKTFKNYTLGFISDDIESKFKNGITGNELVTIILNKTPYSYIKNAMSFRHQQYFDANPRPLPKWFLGKYGETTIDIVPTDIDYIYFNKLNYQPRPVIQSYQANSEWLMAKNGDSYMSPKAPQTVLYSVQGFREQNPFFIETDLTEALLQRYKIDDMVVMATDTFFVFCKQNNTKNLISSQLQKKQFDFDEQLTIPYSIRPVKFSAQIEYSFLGKMARLFFQPPYFFYDITYENGKTETYRAIDKIVKGGIIVNRKVTTQAEVASFFDSEGKDNIKITKIRFWTKHSWGFKQHFDGIFKEIIIK